MINGFLVKKVGMTQKYRENGDVVAATVLEGSPCHVLAIRNQEKDGHQTIQLAAGKKRRISKPLAGQTKKAKLEVNPEIIREIGLTKEAELPEIGREIKVDEILSPGLLVDVIGVTKGRGFAGAIKRWGFAGHPESHGHGKPRTIGSIGPSTPGEVAKGKKMPGHMGNIRKTAQNLEVLSVDGNTGEVLIKGAIPGARNGWLLVLIKGKAKNFSPLTGNKNETKES